MQKRIFYVLEPILGWKLADKAVSNGHSVAVGGDSPAIIPAIVKLCERLKFDTVVTTEQLRGHFEGLQRKVDIRIYDPNTPEP